MEVAGVGTPGACRGPGQAGLSQCTLPYQLVFGSAVSSTATPAATLGGLQSTGLGSPHSTSLGVPLATPGALHGTPQVIPLGVQLVAPPGAPQAASLAAQFGVPQGIQLGAQLLTPQGATQGAALGAQWVIPQGATQFVSLGAQFASPQMAPQNASLGAQLVVPQGATQVAALGALVAAQGGQQAATLVAPLGAAQGAPPAAAWGPQQGVHLPAPQSTPEGVALGAPLGAPLPTALGAQLGFSQAMTLAQPQSCGLQAGSLVQCAAPARGHIALEQSAALLGIDPQKLRLAQSVGALRLRMIQEATQQQYLQAYAHQVAEVQDLQEKQQEAAQLALIMEAAEAQAEMAKQSLEDEKEDREWARGRGRFIAICGNWQRGYCKHAEACQFSHPEKEFGSSSTKRGPADLMRHNFKTAVCRLFSTGTCAHGSRCMFAHGPGELRSPGMALSKDEDDMVHKVAAGGKRNKEAAAAASSAPVQPASGLGGLALPTPSVAQQVATAQMIALAGHAAAAMPPLSGLGLAQQTPAPEMNLDSAQKVALAGLSKLGLDSSTLSLMGQLASGDGLPPIGGALTTMNPPKPLPKPEDIARPAPALTSRPPSSGKHQFSAEMLDDTKRRRL